MELISSPKNSYAEDKMKWIMFGLGALFSLAFLGATVYVLLKLFLVNKNEFTDFDP